jgi:16S rRNA (cytosine967-C5)-methyltransferase
LSAEAAPGAALRASAARLLVEIGSGASALEEALTRPAAGDVRDASLLRAIIFGCLRWHHRLKWQTDRLLTKPLAGRDTVLAALLRVGLFQLQWLRVPDHAAVSATVDAAALIGKPQAKTLVNAVLRRFQRERVSLERRMQREPVPRFSHPRWLIERLRDDWGGRHEAVLDANNREPPMWLRVNLRRIERDVYLKRLEEAGIDAVPGDESSASILLAAPRATESLPGFAEGLVSVQDAAAQLAAGFMQLREGLRVLDACAAPGNKTAHLLEYCPGLGDLWALDSAAPRLDAVGRTLKRLGLAATLVHANATEVDTWWDGREFDRILLDAPCSAVGVIRRHPDIKLLRKPHDIARLTHLQRELLEALWPLLKPGGRLVYATCTVIRDENQRQIERFVGAMPDARLTGPGPDGDLQLFPGQANMDGFYYACVDKQNVLRSVRAPAP